MVLTALKSTSTSRAFWPRRLYDVCRSGNRSDITDQDLLLSGNGCREGGKRGGWWIQEVVSVTSGAWRPCSSKAGIQGDVLKK